MGVTESGKKLAITAFAFQLQEEKYFPLPFLNLAIILLAEVFDSILKTAPIWFDC